MDKKLANTKLGTYLVLKYAYSTNANLLNQAF